MKEQNYWRQFVSTGSIEDYLCFKKEQDVKAVPKKDGDSFIMGESPYAGVCKVNRNDFEDGAYRGIR